MITVIQRIQRAQVSIDGQVTARAGPGLLLLVGIERGDNAADADATAQKTVKLRCFPGRTPMDRTVGQVGGSCLVVSQFTLAAELVEGNRPSFVMAADPEHAEPLYERICMQLRAAELPVATGRFGATMAVELVNDGPVTFVLTVRGGRVLPRSTKPGGR